MKKNRIYSLVALLSLFAAVSSCDDEAYDVTGNPNELIYFSANQNQTFSVISTPEGYMGDKVEAKLGLRITRPLGGNATVAAVVDNDLVATYNAAHNTDYKVFPGSVDVKAASFTSGSYQSADSIEVSLPSEQYSALGREGSYLLPVHLTEATAGKVTVTDKATAYILVNVERKDINTDVKKEDITGTLASNRSSWSVISEEAITDWSKLFDDDKSSSVSFSSNNPTITIDLKEVKTLTGIYMNSGSSYNRFSAEISFSEDNANYTKAGNTKNLAEHYIQVYGLSVRYIRMKLSWGYYYGRPLGDFNVYTK